MAVARSKITQAILFSQLWYMSGIKQVTKDSLLTFYVTTAMLSVECFFPFLVNFNIDRVQNKVFCLTGHFWCWCKSYCSLPIATEDFGSAVSPLFCTAFKKKAFLISTINKCLICRKSTFPHLFNSIFFFENTSMDFHLVPNTLSFKAEQSCHFCKANIPRSYSMPSHTHTKTHSIKYYVWFIRFWY